MMRPWNCDDGSIADRVRAKTNCVNVPAGNSSSIVRTKDPQRSPDAKSAMWSERGKGMVMPPRPAAALARRPAGLLGARHRPRPSFTVSRDSAGEGRRRHPGGPVMAACSDVDAAPECQERDREIVALRKEPSERMVTCCRLPRVLSERSALNEGPVTTTPNGRRWPCLEDCR